ncbi:unnamed protein product [Brachionus calyciflorus]|uniref:Uncharacterized protein n=1 Tax=Brachionus calyciflorus TaxID=104777 RepID=A0A814P1I2_9BILA|nr:unnamed protein product [Brachionus calyciflorus]
MVILSEIIDNLYKNQPIIEAEKYCQGILLTAFRDKGRISLISTILEEEVYSNAIVDVNSTNLRIDESLNSDEGDNMLLVSDIDRLIVEDSFNQSNNESQNLSEIVVQPVTHGINKSAFENLIEEGSLHLFCNKLFNDFNKGNDFNRISVLFDIEEFKKWENNTEILKQVFKAFGDLLFLRLSGNLESNLITTKINSTN